MSRIGDSGLCPTCELLEFHQASPKEGALDNRRGSWQDDSCKRPWRSFGRATNEKGRLRKQAGFSSVRLRELIRPNPTALERACGDDILAKTAYGDADDPLSNIGFCPDFCASRRVLTSSRHNSLSCVGVSFLVPCFAVFAPFLPHFPAKGLRVLARDGSSFTSSGKPGSADGERVGGTHASFPTPRGEIENV